MVLGVDWAGLYWRVQSGRRGGRGGAECVQPAQCGSRHCRQASGNGMWTLKMCVLLSPVSTTIHDFAVSSPFFVFIVSSRCLLCVVCGVVCAQAAADALVDIRRVKATRNRGAHSSVVHRDRDRTLDAEESESGGVDEAIGWVDRAGGRDYSDGGAAARAVEGAAHGVFGDPLELLEHLHQVTATALKLQVRVCLNCSDMG
jgi:hypothetical protein